MFEAIGILTVIMVVWFVIWDYMNTKKETPEEAALGKKLADEYWKEREEKEREWQEKHQVK